MLMLRNLKNPSDQQKILEEWFQYQFLLNHSSENMKEKAKEGEIFFKKYLKIQWKLKFLSFAANYSWPWAH